MKYYFVKALCLPFPREWFIFNKWISTDKEKLIEKVRSDLEEEVFMRPTTLKLDEDGWLIINGDESEEKWLQLNELTEV